MRTYPLQGSINLNAVLTMGQTFAWKKRGEWHVGSIGGQVVRVKTENGGATLIADAPDDRPRRYFDAERDMQALRREIALRCPRAARAAAQFPQIRMLRQPLWECLAGFLLSSVNNIKRIARIVENLSQSLGGEQTVGGQKERAFPSAEAVAETSIESLYALGTGFRARGLQAAARAARDGELDAESLRRAPMEEARQTLMGLRGVGPKIADCVLLYALDHARAFPLDVWMLREMRRIYFKGEERPAAEIQAFAQTQFGEFAGYAQLYLYHAARMRQRG